MMLDQLGIFILGGAAVWFVGGTGEAQFWGYVLGLASQPFWARCAWRARQWGVLALTAWYTLSWARGAWLHWPY